LNFEKYFDQYCKIKEQNALKELELKKEEEIA